MSAIQTQYRIQCPVNCIEGLHQEKIDVMLGNHVWNNNTEEYGKILLETGENKFINDKPWDEFLGFCEKRLDKIIAKEHT